MSGTGAPASVAGLVIGKAVRSSEWGVLGLIECDGAVIELALADDRAGLGGAFDREAETGPVDGARDLADEVARRIGAGEDFEGIPVETSGTEFQEAVWQELAGVPRGEVVSYSELARRMGRPEAARAVASACGANPVALIVPCHRVVSSDGTAGGYRWGTDRKVRILGDEGVELRSSGRG